MAHAVQREAGHHGSPTGWQQVGNMGNRDDHKKVSGRSFDLLPANPTKMTNRQFGFMVGDEIDTYAPRMCSSFLDQARIRGRALGTNRKVGMASHPDRGWSTGIALAWIESSRGIFVMPCAECEQWASPYPTKYWPEVPRYRLWYDNGGEGTERDQRIELARSTAAMACPHCGALLTDEQRHAMVDAAVDTPSRGYLHRGQTLDAELGVIGEIEPNPARGFWVHGLMSKMIANAELARDLESAVIAYETTRKVDKLREVTAKVFGEVFEGASASGALDAAELHGRRKARAAEGAGFTIGTVPREVLFLTLSVDVGHSKFDFGLWGWDLEGRSWLVDRGTIRQRLWPDGTMRDVRPSERIDDWSVLELLIARKVPLAADPMQGLPLAITTIDTGDGNVTWKAYEFIRRMYARRWGGFQAVWAIKGLSSAAAPELPANSTPIARDQEGKEVHPVIRLKNLGAHRLKEQALERLAVDDDGPGQCYFANEISRRHLDEFFGERLIAGAFERTGDNETLDLFAYAEAGRLMLMPDRRDIQWAEPRLRPIWARPEALFSEGGDLEPSAPMTPGASPAKANILDRFDGLNRRK